MRNWHIADALAQPLGQIGHAGLFAGLVADEDQRLVPPEANLCTTGDWRLATAL